MKIVDGKAVAETPEEEAALKVLAEDHAAGLKAKNSELLGKLKELDPLKGIDPEKYRTLEAQAAKAEEERAIKAGEFDNLKKQLVEAHAKEKQAWEAEKAKLHKSLEENVLVATATQAIAAEKGVAALLMPHVRSRTKLDENGQAVVIDESGNVRVAADGKPLPITALIAEMKADVQTFGRAFEPSGASGAGSQGSSGAGSASKYEGMSPTERMTAARAAGQKT